VLILAARFPAHEWRDGKERELLEAMEGKGAAGELTDRDLPAPVGTGPGARRPYSACSAALAQRTER